MDDLCNLGLSEQDHPELFTSLPPQPSPLKSGQLSEQQVKQFFDEGFLILENYLEPEELAPSIKVINDMVDEFAHRLYDAGKVKNLYSECGFENRLTMLEKEYPGANIVFYLQYGGQPNKFTEMWTHERLLNLAEQILGTRDISGNPAWNLRPKTPKSEITELPWHQDASYFDNTTYSHLILSAWIPFVDTTLENGCLQVARYAHKRGRVAKHNGCWKDSWFLYMDDEEMTKSLGVDFSKDIVTCEVPFGSVLLFNQLTPHRSLPNTSNGIRWSMDFRWQSANQPSGFFGLKDAIRMRSSEDENYRTDWAPFLAVDRRKRMRDATRTVADEFETTNPGPWMLKWPLVNETRHTRALATIDRESYDWKHMIVG
jgi:ectoine hydroxylase-related dioxygenase (phytanoyl-CoA dioxygenase family)